MCAMDMHILLRFVLIHFVYIVYPQCAPAEMNKASSPQIEKSTDHGITLPQTQKSQHDVVQASPLGTFLAQVCFINIPRPFHPLYELPFYSICSYCRYNVDNPSRTRGFTRTVCASSD